MSKLYLNWLPQPLLQNPQKSTFYANPPSKYQSVSMFATKTQRKPYFDRIHFNLKKDTPQLRENRSEFLKISQIKLSQSEKHHTKHQHINEKPTNLSTVWQKIKDQSHCFQSYIAPKSQDEYPCLALRKTETSETQSSLIRSEIFGHKISDYKMISLLGRGRFGEVFLASEKRTGFIGAMKVLQKKEILKLEPEQRQKMIKQITNEIKLQSYMDHPNIIKLYTYFHDYSNIYLFLELGTDGHLLDLLSKRQKLQEETTSIIIREVTRGIRYMHQYKIIHRDIKLQNIVLTCGMAKICDFGWTTYLSKNMRSTICGTPLYLSPQVLKGKQYNHKIDIWAIGTLAFQMAMGENPFGVKKREDLSKIITKDFEMDRGSPELKSFITFILRKDPQRRPDAQILMKHPFITKFKHIQTSQQVCQLTNQ